MRIEESVEIHLVSRSDLPLGEPKNSPTFLGSYITERYFEIYE